MCNPEKIVTRFAPSPTGYLHPGHFYSARLAYDFAHDTAHDCAGAGDGTFLLRIEDIDQTRCQAIYEDAIYRDLKAQGLVWPEPVRRQSEHMADYGRVLNRLQQQNLLYPCFCSRKDIQREIAESSHAPHHMGPHPAFGLLYPGTCRTLDQAARAEKQAAGRPYALRLDMGRALGLLAEQAVEYLVWYDLYAGIQQTTPEILRTVIGDVVLARKDCPTSYHLSVVVDDHLQHVTHVIRGEDLFMATHLHRLLQFLLDYASPVYGHHKLVRDSTGRRYAKRNRHPA